MQELRRDFGWPFSRQCKVFVAVYEVGLDRTVRTPEVGLTDRVHESSPMFQIILPKLTYRYFPNHRSLFLAVLKSIPPSQTVSLATPRGWQQRPYACTCICNYPKTFKNSIWGMDQNANLQNTFVFSTANETSWTRASWYELGHKPLWYSIYLNALITRVFINLKVELVKSPHSWKCARIREPGRFQSSPPTNPSKDAFLIQPHSSSKTPWTH